MPDDQNPAVAREKGSTAKQSISNEEPDAERR
jgi:hypothetical protein